jgi:hypothetical protein
VEVEERHQGEEGERDDALVAVEEARREPPSDPQRKAGIRHRQQVIGPIADGEDGEPRPHHHRRERRMFRVAQRQLAREGELLGHVGVDVLTGLGQRAVERPERHIAQENGDHRALAPRGIAERSEQPLDQREAAAAGIRHGRHRMHPARLAPPFGRRLWHDGSGRSISRAQGPLPRLCRIGRRC